MAAIHGKFSMILKSGKFVLKCQSVQKSGVLPEITLALQFSRSPKEGNIESMKEDAIVNLIQQIGFANHGSDASLDSDMFNSIFKQLLRIRDMFQEMMSVGYRNAPFESMEFPIASPESPAEIEGMLKVSTAELEKCKDWLQHVRSSFKYSLLFHMDELFSIYRSMKNARDIVGKGGEVGNSSCVRKILEALSRLSPLIAQHPDCHELVIEHVSASLSDEISWLEDGTKYCSCCSYYHPLYLISSFQCQNS